ncbi:hypothetical protein niasHS_009528 [Heterodera schachtii]|uniref:Uncharacterized protein n=1 Tax=Heterodera schachtii TaxID=97005 RepID=A0ABD2J0Z1_HETSC
MSYSLNSTISEFTVDQAPFENENLTPFEALRRVRMTELERLQKMNSEKGNEENDNKINTTKADILAGRMKLLLSTAKFADAHFLVGQNDKKQLVLAHRAILSASSDVFEAMFQKEATENANGKIASSEKDGPVLIPDVDAEAFKVMLRFIYSDDLSELNGQNAAEVLYAALKFNVIGLVKACADFPIPKLTNVFAALSFARFNDLLKDFVQRCLAYIDKNADDLLKSEEFLQIDQNLLCEIFGPENRRTMLDPALYKIRFPLISKEEFTKKIVPSDVLSKDEVIAVYQFHSLPNCRGICDGLLPMQFSTNGRISDRKKGTLLMDIEKVSEFAREDFESRRYSEKVYINGLSWKILAQIKTKNGSSDNKKWLGFSLVCDAPEEDLFWNSCYRSATFRIVSQKSGAMNSIGTLTDRVFYKMQTKEGFPNFISFAELLDPSNGFYNKEEDKVKLAIDVITVDEPKVDNLILDKSKSKGALFMDIEKVSEFSREVIGSERKSETVHIKGFPWKIWAKIEKKNENTDNEKFFGFYLLCNVKDWFWRCFVRSATFRIVSQKNGAENSTGTLCDHVFNKSTGWGFENFISFAELMDPANGFYDKNEDKVTLTIDVITVDEPKMDKLILDQPKSNATISMEIEKVSEFAREIIGSKRKSKTVHIKGFPWKILAQIEKNNESTDNGKFFGFYLSCDAPKGARNWSCKCSAILRIVSKKNGVSDFRREFDDNVFDSKVNNCCWGYPNFISFAELIDTSNGFYDKSEDNVTLAIDFTVKEAKTEDFGHFCVFRSFSAIFGNLHKKMEK